MAFDAGSVVANIQARIDNFKAGLDSVKQELDKTQTKAKDFAKSMKEAGEKVTKVGKDLTLKVTAPIVAAGTAAVKFAADLEDAIGATDQIFGSASQSMQKWADNLESYYGIAEGEALTYANTMGSMLQNIGGMSEAEAAKQSKTLIGLAGDLTAMFGGTTEDAVRALTGALKGNNTMLDNYGMAVNEAMIKTKALEMGLIREGEEMTLAAKQGATLALIMEQTGAAQGQAAREAEGTSGTIRSLLTVLKNLSAEIGQVLLPMVTPLIAKVRDWIQRFSQLSPAAKRVIVIIAGIVAAIGPLLLVGGQLVTSFGAIIGVLGGLSAPVLLVVGAVGGLVAALVYAYRNSEQFREAVSRAFTRLQRVAGAIFERLAGFAQRAFEQIGAFWDEHGEKIISVAVAVFERLEGALSSLLWLFNGILNGDIQAIMENFWHFFYSIFGEKVANFMEGNLAVILEKGPALFNIMKDNVISALGMLRDGVSFVVTFIRDLWDNHLEAIVTRVIDVFGKVSTFITGLLMDVATFVQEKLQVIFEFWDEHGAMIMEGARNYLNGVWAVVSWVINAIITVFNWAWPYISKIVMNAWEMIKGVISGAVDIILGIVRFFGALFTGDWEEVWEAVKDILGGAVQIIQSIFGGLWGYIKIFFADAWAHIKALPGKLWTLLKQTVVKVIDWGLEMEAKSKQAAMDAINVVIDWFKSLPGKVWDWLVEVVSNLTQWGNDMKTEAETSVSDFIDSIVDWFQSLPGRIGEALTTFGQAIGTFFTETLPYWFGYAIGTMIKWQIQVWQWAGDTASNIVTTFVTWISKLPGQVWEWLTTAWEDFTTWGQDMLTLAEETAENLVDAFITWVSGLPGRIWTFLSQAWTDFSTWGLGMATAAAEFALGIVTGMINWIQTLPDRIWEWLLNVVQRFLTWREDIIAKATEIAQGIVAVIVEWIKTLPGKVWTWLKQVVTDLIAWGVDLYTEAESAVNGVIEGIIEWFSSLPGELLEIGKDMIQGLIDGVKSMVGGAVEAAKSVVSSITGGIKDALGISSPSKVLMGFGVNMGEGLANGIEATKRMVAAAADRMAMAATPSFAGVGGFSMPAHGDNSTTNNVPITIYVYGNPTQDGLNQIENATYNGVTKAVQRRRIRSGRL